MRRVSAFVPCIACFLLASQLLCPAPSAAQQRTPPAMPGRCPDQAHSLSINGKVTDAVTHAHLDNVKIELHSVAGGISSTTFTSGGGTFQLNSVAEGDYTVVADSVGYQTASVPVEIQCFSVFGVQVELRRATDTSTPVSIGPAAVSLRELSIPPKAHDDMEKGMALLYGKSDYRGSLKAFENATEEYPDYYEAYTQIGIAYMRLADAANSEKAFRKAIELSQQSYSVAYVGLADLFLKGGRFADAETLARKATEIDSTSWQAQSELARVLLGLQRFSEAEACAVAAVALKPDNETLYLILANVHIQLQNEPALLDDLNHYLKIAPAGPFAEQARLQRDQVQEALAASQKQLPAASPTSQP
jgi:hypothetical protein